MDKLIEILKETNRTLSEETEELKEENRQLGNKIEATIEFLGNFLPNYSIDHIDIEKAIKILKGEE